MSQTSILHKILGLKYFVKSNRKGIKALIKHTVYITAFILKCLLKKSIMETGMVVHGYNLSTKEAKIGESP